MSKIGNPLSSHGLRPSPWEPFPWEEFSDLLIALENNPNNDIDIGIEAWRDTESLVKSFEDLYIYLRKNSKHKIIF